MAGEIQNTQTAYIGAPIDGVNLVAPPNQIPPTEARQLDNYYPFDWGIRQRAGGTLRKDFTGSLPYAVSLFIPFAKLAGIGIGEDNLIACSQRKIWRFNIASDTAPTDITAGSTFESFTHYVNFNSRIFFFNGRDIPLYINLLTNSTAAPAGFTGPTDVSTLLQPTTYKDRIYVTEKDTSKFWYAGVGAITGPMVSFDLAQVFHRGGVIAVLTSWSFNQGIGSEEFLIAISNLGEVLVYSGDYPEATNWQLAGRTSIPRPVGTRCHIRVAQDVYVGTMRGVLALSRVFSGNTDDRYYIVSNNLGPNMELVDTQPGYNVDYPFLYFIGNSGRVLYVLNYERGAWSRFTYWHTIVPDSSAVNLSAVAVAFGSLWLGTATTENKVYRFDDFQAGATSSVDAHIWKTPFLGFDNGLVKSSKYVRVVARDMGTANITNTVSIATDFKNTDIDSLGNPFPGSELQPNQDTVTTPNPHPSGSAMEVTHDWVVQELRPPGNGKTLSYIFSKGGNYGDLNEIAGAEVMIETGGAYG